MQGVAGSSPASSTPTRLGYTLAGFIAGEGYFSVVKTQRVHRSGEPIQQFLFGVHVAEHDVSLVEGIKTALGGGSIRWTTPANDHWKPTVVYSLKSIRAHKTTTIPFMERYLLRCAKRRQFESWRDDMETYIERHNVRWAGRSTCSEEGCDRFVRGRGLCRSHYYRETGW